MGVAYYCKYKRKNTVHVAINNAKHNLGCSLCGYCAQTKHILNVFVQGIPLNLRTLFPAYSKSYWTSQQRSRFFLSVSVFNFMSPAYAISSMIILTPRNPPGENSIYFLASSFGANSSPLFRINCSRPSFRTICWPLGDLEHYCWLLKQVYWGDCCFENTPNFLASPTLCRKKFSLLLCNRRGRRPFLPLCLLEFILTWLLSTVKSTAIS